LQNLTQGETSNHVDAQKVIFYVKNHPEAKEDAEDYTSCEVELS
jgi:hypothetical protein